MRMSDVSKMDFSTVVILVDQIAGVEDATPESVKAMSAVSRSGQNEHDAPCLAYVLKWPFPAYRRSSAYSGTTDGFERRATAEFDA